MLIPKSDPSGPQNPLFFSSDEVKKPISPSILFGPFDQQQYVNF